ncbi:gag protein [Lentinula edodes]|uniref:Gag protein n=1 Tax=Lentinula edodes TaxID=5353 RepID=A0A1Q3ELX5_LENED|nr:gag protein [Lentinula edodes]
MSTPVLTAQTTSADELMTQLIKQVANLATAMEECSSSKSSMNKPEVFKGKDSNEARCFRAQFQNWASEQPDLAKSQVKLIKSALGFFTEGAGDWATPHLLHFNAENPLFEGSWEKFLLEFGQRFESIDPGMEARNAIQSLKQGKGQTVAEFAQKFQDIGSWTGMSDIDLREHFYSALLPKIQQNLIMVNIGQGVARTLKEAITQAVSVDVYLHDPTLTGQNLGPTRSHATPADPHSMDINATHTSNGNTREAFLARMRGRCFGCGAQGH